MNITQTVEIPANHRLVIDVPREVPAGRTILTFIPAPDQNASAGKSNRKPISMYFGILSPGTYGDGVAYQRNLPESRFVLDTNAVIFLTTMGNVIPAELELPHNKEESLRIFLPDKISIIDLDEKLLRFERPG